MMNPSTSSTLSDGPPEDGEDLVPTKTQVLPAEETDGTQGGQVFGRFRLLMEMGEGGMATLFLARIRGPKMFEKMVAIKRIHGHLTGNEEFVDMFLDEARIAALIHHPNVVNTFDLGIIDGSHFIAMEYVHGQTLLDLFKKSLRLQVPIPWEHAVRIVADAAAGLHAAHELKTSAGESMGVVHRDVSPQNILISYEGHVKVVDFGIAYATEKLSHTKTGMVRGKIPYMSPEQTRSEPLDRRSDIFSLGIVLYELVCMKRLFKASSESESLRLVRAAHMELLPREIRSELPVALEKVIVQCLAREPEARYASAGDLAEALEALLIRDGKAVSSQSFARFMERMFHTQRKLKDAQIQKAVKSTTSTALPSVGMLGGTSSAVKITPDHRSTRFPRSGQLFVVGLGVAVVAVALMALYWWAPFSRERTTSSGASPSASTMQSEPAPISTVSLRIKVQPAVDKVQIVFRGQSYRGSTLKLVVVRSEKMEHLTVSAPGFQTENLLVAPVTDKEIPVKLSAVTPGAPAARSVGQAPDGSAPHPRTHSSGRRRPGMKHPSATNNQPKHIKSPVMTTPAMPATPAMKEPGKPKDLSAPWEW